MDLPEIVTDLIHSRLSDLKSRDDFVNPLNGEIDQELIEDTIQEISELEDFLYKHNEFELEYRGDTYNTD
jgi:hypothetical protein